MSGARKASLGPAALALAFSACLGLAGCASLRPEPEYGKEVKDRLLLLDKSADEIVKLLGEPERMLNVEGMGFYGYEDYGFYFDNIVFVYGKSEKLRILNNRARILVIDCLGPTGPAGILRGKSGVEELVAALGQPRRRLRIPAGEESFVPFAGEYYLYPVEGSQLGFRVDGGLVRSILLIDGRCAAFK